MAETPSFNPSPDSSGRDGAHHDHSDHETVEQRVQRHLRNEAELVPLLPVGTAATDRIQRRAVRAQRRRTVAVGSAMALTIAAAGFGALSTTAPTNDLITADQVNESVDVLNTPQESEASTSDGASDGAPNGESAPTVEALLASPGPTMAWSEIAESPPITSDVVVYNGSFIGLGSDNNNVVLWVSEDGTQWRPVESELNFRPWGLRAVGDALVVSGTAPSPDELDEGFIDENVRTAYSLDGGQTWIEPDLAPTDDSSQEVGEVSIAAIGDVVIAARTAFSPSGDVDTSLHRSIGGAAFEPLEISSFSISDFPDLRVIGDELQIGSYGSDSTVAVSTDGLTWVIEPDTSSTRDIVQSTPDRLIAFSYAEDAALIERSTDGGETWLAPFDLPAVNLLGAAVNEDGYVLTAFAEDWEPGTEDSFEIEPLTLEKDDLAITVTFGSDISELFVVDLETGEEIFRSQMVGDADEGPGIAYDEDLEVITITDLETDAVVVTFSEQEFADVIAASPLATAPEQFGPSTLIGFTEDGTEFSWQTTEDAFGLPGAAWADVTSDGSSILAVVLTAEGDSRVFIATGPEN